jgi:predicted esterase
MAILRHMIVPKTVRYYQTKEITNQIKNIWMVLHGYGHLAEFFIRKFEVLNDETSVVIAPEGMHRFYLKGVFGMVGASWMTKEDRENDIYDYIQFLNRLLVKFKNETNPSVNINLLGFSQGGATACRFALASDVELNALILFSSVFPPDLEFKSVNLPRIPNIIAAIGDEDEYVSTKEFNENIEFWNQKGLITETILFNGRHEINADVLNLIKRKLA